MEVHLFSFPTDLNLYTIISLSACSVIEWALFTLIWYAMKLCLLHPFSTTVSGNHLISNLYDVIHEPIFFASIRVWDQVYY